VVFQNEEFDMNLKNFLLLRFIFGVFCEKILVENSEILSISKAIYDFTEEFYIKSQIQFDFVYINDDASKFSQIIHHLLVQNGATNPHKTFLFLTKLKKTFGVVRSAIVLADSCTDLRFIHTNIGLGGQYTKIVKFLIYVEGCGYDFIKNDLEHLIVNQQLTTEHGLIEQYEFLLISDEDFLHLATIEWFTEAACNQAQLKVLNSFNKITLQWTKNLENYEKFQDFRGCKLKIWIPNDLTLVITDSNDLRKSSHEGAKNGLIPYVFTNISRKYNFMPVFQPIKEYSEVYIDVFRLISAKEMKKHFTASFMETRDLIFSTPGDLYTPYEKLWLPFDDPTWKFLFVTFFVAFLTIFLINLLPRTIREIVYGVNVHKPALNVISAFFGISQYKVPKKYFSRCLFIIFVFFCLIFRTCYQSKLFEFMTSEPRRPPPKNIQDLKDNNYSMYTYLRLNVLNEMIEDEKNKWYVNIDKMVPIPTEHGSKFLGGCPDPPG